MRDIKVKLQEYTTVCHSCGSKIEFNSSRILFQYWRPNPSYKGLKPIAKHDPKPYIQCPNCKNKVYGDKFILVGDQLWR